MSRKNENEQITVAIASQPHRKHGLLNVIYELLPQCDRLCVCLNGYDSVPSEIPKSDKIITVLANENTGIPDLGCNNKMYWAGDFPGYYATVDDDIDYPPNYISSLKAKVDKYGCFAICSYHGHIYNNVKNGRITFSDRTVYAFQTTCKNDIYCHRLGMGVAMCCPQKIGLTKKIFLTKPKNFGDDELTAIWAQMHNVPLIRVSNENVTLIENINLSRTNSLCVNDHSMKTRSAYLESYTKWTINTVKYDNLINSDPFFRIIVPTYNVEHLIDRCIESIMNQSFKNFKIIIIDDMSTDNTRSKIESLAKKYVDHISYRFTQKHVYGGGARNIGMTLFKESTYTLFVDSDDYYAETDSLLTLKNFIETNKYPDIVKCSYKISNNGNITCNMLDGSTLSEIVHLNAPWTSCVKTKLCAEFIPDRIRFNDVVWSLRTYNNARTLAVLKTPIYVYTIGDNAQSSQHSQLDNTRKAAIYYLIADLMMESYKNPIVEQSRKQIISSKINYLKNNGFCI